MLQLSLLAVVIILLIHLVDRDWVRKETWKRDSLSLPYARHIALTRRLACRSRDEVLIRYRLLLGGQRAQAAAGMGTKQYLVGFFKVPEHVTEGGSAFCSSDASSGQPGCNHCS